MNKFSPVFRLTCFNATSVYFYPSPVSFYADALADTVCKFRSKKLLISYLCPQATPHPPCLNGLSHERQLTFVKF